MAVIQKRADELKPGDVIYFDRDRRVVLYSHKDEHDSVIQLTALLSASEKEAMHSVARRIYAANFTFSVDLPAAPDLTPAQQHAEALAAMLRRAVEWSCKNNSPAPDWEYPASQVLDVIKPPEPPTLAEALEELDSLRSHAKSCGAFEHCGAVMERRANDLLDRARRAGVM